MALVIHARELEDMVARKVNAALLAAGSELHRISRLAASRPNTGVTVRITKRRKGGNKRTRTIYPDPSKPGESPKRRTGFGHKNIVWGFSPTQQEARVGYTRSARYMTFHELGIRYKRRGREERPTIVPAFKDNQGRIFQVARRAMLRA